MSQFRTGTYLESFEAQAVHLATGRNTALAHGVLRSLGMPGIGDVVWQNAVRDEVRACLDDLPEERPAFDRVVPTLQVAEAFEGVSLASGFGDGLRRTLLADQIASLAQATADVLDATLLRVRLDTADQLPLGAWQVAAPRARLVCALIGTGLEYGAAKRDGGHPDALALPMGAAGLFRGLLGPGPELTGIVHRAVAHDHERPALLLMIEPVDEVGRC